MSLLNDDFSAIYSVQSSKVVTTYDRSIHSYTHKLISAASSGEGILG